jgi:hypothetical protein
VNFIERLFDLYPDQGNGLCEIWCFILVIEAGFLLAHQRMKRRRPSLAPAVKEPTL